MTLEDIIKQSADNYIGHEYEISESIPTTMRRCGYVAGAKWLFEYLCKNSLFKDSVILDLNINEIKE